MIIAKDRLQIHVKQSTDFFKILRRNYKIIGESIGVFLLGVTFFSIFIWYMKSDPILETSRVPFKNKFFINATKIPSIVWHTNLVYWRVPTTRKRYCFNGSQNLKCNVYPRGCQENPEAYLFYGAYIGDFPLPRNPKTIWGLLHDESYRDKSVLFHEKALNLFNFSATYSRLSDVPLPLYWMRKGLDGIRSTKYFVNTTMKNQLLYKFAPVIFLQSDCDTATGRDEYVKKLMDYIKVDCYGICLHNKDMPLAPIYTSTSYINNLFGEDLLVFTGQYKFMITIENSICKDYTTEKLWRALDVGTVPIYYGSPLIRDWLPNNKSAILLEDFPTPELLSQHLHYLLQNDTAYEEYLEHKILGVISNQKLVDEMTTRSYQNNPEALMERFECFVCERLYDIEKKRVNIVTKKQYDCLLPTSALTLTVNPNNSWARRLDDAKTKVDKLYEEMKNTHHNPHYSYVNWW